MRDITSSRRPVGRERAWRAVADSRTARQPVTTILFRVNWRPLARARCRCGARQGWPATAWWLRGF